MAHAKATQTLGALAHAKAAQALGALGSFRFQQQGRGALASTNAHLAQQRRVC